MTELLQGAVREAGVKGINFAVVRDWLSNTQFVFPLPGFSCSPKDHTDLAYYTNETHCRMCQLSLFDKSNGLGLVRLHSRADVDRYLLELDETLKQQDLSADARSKTLANKALYLGSIGHGPEMLEAAQQAYDLLKTRDSTKALAEALFVNGRLEESGSILQEVVQYPDVAWKDRLHYATSLRYAGRVHEAAEIERKYHCAPARYLPQWTGQPCKTVHIFLDNGFGDCLYNLRYLDRIKAQGVQEIIICVPPQYGEDFATLLRAQTFMPQVVMVPDDFTDLRKEITHAIGAGDIECTLDLSLAKTPAQPLWTIDAESKAKYVHLRRDKPLVGICWAAAQPNNRWAPGGVFRSLTHAQVEKIVRAVDGIQFVNLQFKQDAPTPEVLTPQVDNWSDSAGLLANLDLVVTVDTAPLHLANAMQVPTFILSSGAMDWRLKYADIFYPGSKRFRNQTFGFDDAIQSLITELNQWSENPVLRQSICV